MQSQAVDMPYEKTVLAVPHGEQVRALRGAMNPAKMVEVCDAKIQF